MRRHTEDLMAGVARSTVVGERHDSNAVNAITFVTEPSSRLRAKGAVRDGRIHDDHLAHISGQAVIHRALTAVVVAVLPVGKPDELPYPIAISRNAVAPRLRAELAKWRELDATGTVIT
jgi:hypothetical protein